jgi:predicted ATPase
MSTSIFPPESNATVPVDDSAFEPLPSGPLELRQFLRTAIRITSVLAQLHGKDTIHRSIRPQNIRIHGPSGHVKLLGQAGAYAVPDPQREAEEAAQALPYMSPEQTEDMKRPTDHRSDLYSLGVVLYELACGKLPFHAEDPMGWVQCHLTIEPPPLTAVAPETPQAISDIISKLLAKTVEERYQSARGLLLDLETCLVELKAKGRIEPFPLGARDVWHGLRISAKLYGRESDVAALYATFERVIGSGKPEIALVSGFSGIGKTSLILALHKPIVRERGFFLSGKFDEHKRNIPYITIGQAFRDIIRQILTERTSQIELWRKRLIDALGPNAQLMIEIIPQLEQLIGKQAPVAELPIRDAQNRFNTVFRSFLGVFAKREHPLVLFLDDLQYADFASLNLLNHVITHGETKHLLVLGAYRDNEVSPSHPAILTLEEIRKSGVHFTSVVLRPLEVRHVQQLAADTLHSELDRAEPLAALVHKKTGGNPFFTNQFIAELHHGDLVRFDVENSVWTWSVDKIREKDFTDDVVELMASKLRRLPGETQAALQLAACIGSEFDVEMLQVTHDKTAEETYEDLDPAVRGEFMLRRGNTYKFMHDRVHQAAYSLIPHEQVTWVHLRIGRLLLERTPESERDDRIFDIVNQLNKGKFYVTESDEQLVVAGLNLAAGLKAKASAAYQSASQYLSDGISLLPPRAWDTEYKLAHELHHHLGECEFINGNFEETERVAGILLEKATSNADKAAAYALRIFINVARQNNAGSVKLGLECLELFGIKLPPNPTIEQATGEMMALRQRLEGKRIEDLIDLPLMTDKDMKAAMHTMSIFVLAAYYTNLNLFALIICHMVRISMDFGITGSSAIGYATFGSLMAISLGDYQYAYRFGKLGYALTEKYTIAVGYKAEVCNLFAGMIIFWTHHVSKALEYSRIGFEAGIENGSVFFGSFNAIQMTTGRFVKGDPLEEVQSTCSSSIDFAVNAKVDFVRDGLRSYEHLIMQLRGLTSSFSTMSTDGFDEDTFKNQEKIPLMQFWFYYAKLQGRYMSGDFAEAVAAAKQGKPLAWAADGMLPLVEFLFFSGLAAAAHHAQADEATREDCGKTLQEAEARFSGWAKSCPDNFEGKRLLLSAEIARIEGRTDETARLYDEAVQAFRQSGFVHNEGMAHELAAKLLLARGDAGAGATRLREAVECYSRWGAHGKVRQLHALFPTQLGSA